MYSWPSSGIPQSIRDDYEISPHSGLMDESEQRNTSRNRTYPEYSAVFSIMVSSDELSVFRSFYDDVIKQSGAFTVPWLESIGFTSHFVQFTEKGPTWNRNETDNHWLLSLPVDIIMMEGRNGYYPPEVV